MKYLIVAAAIAIGLWSVGSAADPRRGAPNPNPNIDMDGYLKISQEAAKHRETRRVSEDEFIQMSKEKGTIVLDARSKQMFDMLHIDGAINLNFSDIDIERLKKVLPDKDARILIYCNNNFRNSERAFASKLPTASLNLSTYIALYNYGYKNVYELAPRVDPATTKLVLVGSEKK